MRTLRLLCAAVGCGLLAQTSAAALDDETGLESGQTIGGNTAHRAAAAGTFLRWGESPSTNNYVIMFETHAGYDGGRRGAAMETRGEAVLYGRTSNRHDARVGLALFGGGNHRGASGVREDSSAGFAGLKLQPAFQDRLGVDAAVAVSYVSRGFNLRPAVVSELLLARRLGEMQLLLNVGYGHGLEDGERSGSARVALLSRVIEELRLGLEAALEADLELDDDEPENEPGLHLNSGAVLSYTRWHLSWTLHGGLATMRYRDSSETLLGVAVGIGMGATL